VYYNLQGQRVEKPRKGIYIHNGRRVVIRWFIKIIQKSPETFGSFGTF
jgi:hypothetical protein